MMNRTDTMTTSGEFRANLHPVSDVCEPEQPAADFDFMGKMIAVFTSNVIDEGAPIDSVEFTIH
jgi:hypothetical protein